MCKISVILLFFMSIVVFASTYEIPNYKMSSFNKAIETIYKNPNSHAININDRIAFDSEQFLGRPYYASESPLGDGKTSKFDQNPLYRTDTFDCVTLVDTAIALAESNDISQFKNNIIKARYRNGSISYLNRDHWFSQVDWNTVNQANGFVKDITRTIKTEEGIPIAQKAVAIINKPSWYRHLLLYNYNEIPNLLGSIRLINQGHSISRIKAQLLLWALKLKGELKTRKENSVIWYAPLSELFEKDKSPNLYLFSQIPSGSVIEIVRPNWQVPTQKPYGTRLNVSHFGLAVRVNGTLMFREASSLEKKVVDIPLINYLKGYIESTTIKGINIEKITYPGGCAN